MGFSAEDLRRISDDLVHVTNDEVRAVYLCCATNLWRLPSLTPVAGAHGYIDREIRYYRGDQWYLSAVLNKGWVLWYFRWPALRDGALDKDDILAAFPKAEATPARDIKLRVKDIAGMSLIIAYLENNLRP